MPRGSSCAAYDNDIPSALPSPSNCRKAASSPGRVMIRTSRIPANIRMDSG